MSKYELALLVLLAVIAVVMIVRDFKVKTILENIRLTIDLQQQTIIELTRTDNAQESHLLANDATLRRLDEQTGKIAKRLFEHTDSRVAHDQGRLSASVERIQKAQFWTTQAREEAHVVLPNKAADQERPAEGLPPQ